MGQLDSNARAFRGSRRLKMQHHCTNSTAPLLQIGTECCTIHHPPPTIQPRSSTSHLTMASTGRTSIHSQHQYQQLTEQRADHPPTVTGLSSATAHPMIPATSCSSAALL